MDKKTSRHHVGTHLHLIQIFDWFVQTLYSAILANIQPEIL